MSKIFGIVAPERSDVEREIQRMNDAFFFKDSMTRRLWQGSGVALGHQSNGALSALQQPAVDAGGTGAAAFAGYLLGYRSEALDLQERGVALHRSDDPAEFAIAFLEHCGLERLQALNGVFTLARWEESPRRLTVVNDRYGMRPLYYAYSAAHRALLFASDLGPVAKSELIETRPDWATWNVFLRMDHLIGDATFFQDVQRLPPASILTFDAQAGLRIRRYWHPEEIQELPEQSLEEMADRAGELFRASLGAAVPEIDPKLWITLSGGHDTRWIAAELTRQRVPLQAYTTRKINRYGDDIEIAKQVANQLGIEHHVVDLPADFLPRYEDLKNRLMDYESDENFYLYPMVKSVPPDYRTCMDGTGDLVINGIFLNAAALQKIRAGNFREVATGIVRKRGIGLLRALGNHIPRDPAMKACFEESTAIDRVENELLRYRDCVDPITWFYFFNRVRREISLAPSHVFIESCETFSPYLDNAFVDYLMAHRPELKVNRRILHAVLERHYPEVTSIPYTHFLSDAQKRAYLADPSDLVAQLEVTCSGLLDRATRARQDWLSGSAYTFLRTLLLFDRLGAVHPMLNLLIKPSVRKYPFPRYFTSFSMLRMVGMLDAWMREYDIADE